jgi:hypothetical protein
MRLPLAKSSPPAGNAGAKFEIEETRMSKIDDLAATVAALEERIVALESKGTTTARKVIPAPQVEEGARILTGLEAGMPQLVLPTDDEYRAMRHIVDGLYPHLKFAAQNPRYEEQDAAEDFAGFKTAFAYLATLARTETLGQKYAVAWWKDGAEAWAREMRLPATIPGRAFVAALVAHADIAFTDLRDYPIFGLAVGDHGRRYLQQWRSVLATGRVLAPVPKPGPRPAVPSPTQLLIVGAPHAA